MALPSQETITMLALDKHQQPVFRVQFIGGGFNLNLLDEAMAFGLHLLKHEPKVVRVGVYDRPPDALSSEEPRVSITRTWSLDQQWLLSPLLAGGGRPNRPQDLELATTL